MFLTQILQNFKALLFLHADPMIDVNVSLISSAETQWSANNMLTLSKHDFKNELKSHDILHCAFCKIDKMLKHPFLCTDTNLEVNTLFGNCSNIAD